MDKIYSRKRLKVLSIKNKFNENYKRKILKISIIIIIAFIVSKLIINTINPIINILSRDKAKSIATEISNEKASNVMKKYEYEDLMTIYKDKNDNITMIKANIIPINKIISDITIDIQKALDTEVNHKLYIRLGAISGSKIFAGSGPKIPIQISTVGDIITEFKSEFVSTGINQTIHRMYLKIDCTVIIVTPFENISETISNEVLLMENLIVGIVPSTYYNLEGIGKNNIVDTIN